VAQSVRDVVEDLYGALSHGDEGWFREHVLQGPESIHIGTTETYWQSSDDLIHALKRAFAEFPMAWHAGPDMVIGQRAGVAWVADRPQVRFDDGSEFLPRVTMVFIDEGGAWKLAHSHYSASSD
jgi:uncharacterized protein (DUF2461 family)